MSSGRGCLYTRYGGVNVQTAGCVCRSLALRACSERAHALLGNTAFAAWGSEEDRAVHTVIFDASVTSIVTVMQARPAKR